MVAIIAHISMRVLMADAFQLSMPVDFSAINGNSVAATMDRSFIDEAKKAAAHDMEEPRQTEDQEEWKNMLTMTEE